MPLSRDVLDRYIDIAKSHLTATAITLRNDIVALTAFLQKVQVQVTDISKSLGDVHELMKVRKRRMC